MNNKPIVLIVDDIESNIKILAKSLQNKYTIKAADNGLKCLELAQTEPIPDLILLDIQMPGMDGYEVCLKLKEEPATKNIPVIFVTCNTENRQQERGFQVGAVDYIVKPIYPPIVAARVKTHITLKRQQDLLMKMAIHDHLTGLYNRHYLLDSSIKKISNAIRQNVPLGLIMMDLDHFKIINDENGHSVGDAVLQEVSTLLQSQCREEDVVTRFGGEEFLILLEHTDLNAASEKAETIRGLIEQLKPEGLEITSSFGVTTLIKNTEGSNHETIDDMVKRADKALYEAKEAGRNQVISS